MRAPLTPVEAYVLSLLAGFPERRLRYAGASHGWAVVDASASGFTYRVRKELVLSLKRLGMIESVPGDVHEITAAGRAAAAQTQLPQ